MTTATERFLKYIAVNTTSVDDAKVYPSSPNQKVLGAQIAEEMKAMGLTDVIQDEYGYVMGTIPATRDKGPTIGLISHLDTSNAVSGGPIHPAFVDYQGGDIVLNKEQDIVMTPSAFPCLNEVKGKRLIVTDGTTLLGADDKAGVAEIMTLAERLLRPDAPKHGKIRIGFTPDEEVGEGTKFFDLEKFGAQIAYTVDGGALGELEYENFNAAGAKITFNGVNTHPGTAKNKMKNAVLYLAEFINMLPAAEAPAHTENREGFYHVSSVNGNESKATLHMIIRDHNKQSFAKRKEFITVLVEFFNRKYGENTVSAEIKDSYYNMLDVIKEHIDIVERAKKAMRKSGVEPQITPIRGGTDGARLSFEGLPCPNLSTGGMNFHSIYEAIPVNAMLKMVEVIKNLVSK